MFTPSRRAFALGALGVCLTAALHAQRVVVEVGARPPQSELARGTALILGRVIDADSGRPVPNVVVRATIQGMTAEQALAELGPLASAGPLVTLTSADGFFLFRELPAAAYNLNATLSGYLSGAFGRTHVEGPGRAIVLDDGQRVTDASITLWRPAVITGTVIDDLGDPAVGVFVRAVRRVGTSFSLSGLGQTDDRGIYRLANVVPGDHLVLITSTTPVLPVATGNALRQTGPGVAALRQELMGSTPAQLSGLMNGMPGIAIGDVELQQMPAGGGTFPIAPRLGTNNEIVVAPTIYHPSATAPAAATVVRAESGREHAGVDLQLRTVRGRRISGTVAGPDGPVSNLPLRLLPTYTDQFSFDGNLDAGVTATDSAGRFTFLGIPPGDYVVRIVRVPRRQAAVSPAAMTTINLAGGGVMMTTGATGPVALQPAVDGPTLSATVTLSVGDRDLTDLAIVLTEGARITGQVVFEGGERPAASEAPRFGVNLIVAGNRTGVSGLPTAVPVDANGQFATAQYPPGSYFLSVSGAPVGWILSRAIVNGVDATQHPLRLASSEMSGALLTMVKTLGSIAGTVRRTGTIGDPDAQVVAFPADYTTWIAEGLSQRLVYRTTVSPDGAFRLPALLAGTYLVVAIDAAIRIDTQSEGVIAALAQTASRVTVVDGQSATQSIVVSAVR